MTELERLTAAVAAQWRADGGADGEPIAVSALLDRVLPYRVARRLLGIDVSEDYEALVLRLLAEEEGLVRVDPADASELAKATTATRIPDLGVLQLLRGASITLTRHAMAQVDQLPSTPEVKETSWGAPDPQAEPVQPAAVPAPGASIRQPVASGPKTATRCWSCSESLPAGREMKFCPFCGADQRQPTCSACGALAERGWKHCPDCGAGL